MPGFLTTVGTSVLCAHGGQAKAAMPISRVKIMKQPVVNKLSPYAITGCVPPAGPPCANATYVTCAVRVKVLGQPVLLQDSQAICAPTGTPLTVIPTQMRVKGM